MSPTRMTAMKLVTTVLVLWGWVWSDRPPRYRAWSATVLSVLAPILWYVAGRVADEWGLFVFVISMATTATAAVIGWQYRSGSSGWAASLGSLMATLWLLIAAAALASAAAGSFDLFLAASEWVNSRLASMGNTVVGFDAAVLVGVSAAGASGLAGLAVIVPLGTKGLSARAVESLDGAIEILMGMLVAAGAVFVVYVIARLIPSPIYTGAVSVAIVALSPVCVAAPPLVGLVLRKAWQVLLAEHGGGDSDTMASL